MVHRILAGIFVAPVRDRRIVASPCEGTKLPKVHRQRIEPMTLDTYSHLWPDSDDRTRVAVDSVLGRDADSVRTGAAL